MGEELAKGVVFHRQGKLQQAEDAYIKALEENPDDVQALYLLGTIYFQVKRYGLAIQLLRRATQLKANYFEAWNNLGNCYRALNKDVESKVCWQKALKQLGRASQEYADVWNNLATVHINAGEPGKADELLQSALALSPDHGDANWNLALADLERGKYKEGFARYRWGFKTKNRIFRDYGDKVPSWDGSSGKNVVVWGEQGIGDEIMFASMLPDLIKVSKSVVFECHPRLEMIFRQSFPSIRIYGTRKDDFINWISNHPEVNAKVAIGELGHYFRPSVESFPKHAGYLKAEPGRVEHYKKKLSNLGPKMKVGVSWTGGYRKTRTDYRSVNLDKWGPIFSNDADFISLQYTPDAYNAIADIEDRLGCRVHHWPSAVQHNNYHETAALVSALDLVITVNTSIHHLAGALGKSCWTMTPHAKAWRYWSPDKENTIIPWYPSVRQYQQEKLYEWEQVVEEVAGDLKKIIEERNENKLCDSCQ